jgi:hypothetical protein
MSYLNPKIRALENRIKMLETTIDKLVNLNRKNFMVIELKEKIEDLVEMIETKCDVTNTEVQEFRNMCLLFDGKLTNQLNGKSNLNEFKL